MKLNNSKDCDKETRKEKKRKEEEEEKDSIRT